MVKKAIVEMEFMPFPLWFRWERVVAVVGTSETECEILFEGGHTLPVPAPQEKVVELMERAVAAAEEQE